jgi:chromosome segregation ATPase
MPQHGEPTRVRHSLAIPPMGGVSAFWPPQCCRRTRRRSVTPDSDQARMSQLEQRVAKVEQRQDGTDAKLHEVDNDIRAFAPLTASYAVMTQQMQTLEKQQGEILKRLDAQDHARDEARKEIERQRADERRDARNSRRALYATMAAVVLASVLGVLVQLLTAGP